MAAGTTGTAGTEARVLRPAPRAEGGEWEAGVAWRSPLHSAVVVPEREELLLYPVPALQAAPQPVGVDHMQLPALLGLAHLLCACRETTSVSAARAAGAWRPRITCFGPEPCLGHTMCLESGTSLSNQCCLPPARPTER